MPQWNGILVNMHQGLGTTACNQNVGGVMSGVSQFTGVCRRGRVVVVVVI